MARRFGSAMISNTDSTRLIYSTEHMRVKAYTGDGLYTGELRVLIGRAGRRKETPDTIDSFDKLREELIPVPKAIP